MMKEIAIFGLGFGIAILLYTIIKIISFHFECKINKEMQKIWERDLQRNIDNYFKNKRIEEKQS